MIGVVIVAHGGLAREYLATIEHVLGHKTGIKAISIGVSDDRPTKTDEICSAADAVDQGDGVVIVTDMFGGSPSNLSMPACIGAQRRIIYGANMPMLIKLAKSRGKSLDVAVALALQSGRKYIDCLAVQDETIPEMP